MTALFDIRPAWIMLVEHDLKGENYRIVNLIARSAAVATVVVCLLLLIANHSDPESYLIGASIIGSTTMFALSAWNTLNSRLRSGELELQSPVGTWGFFLHGIGSGIAPIIPALWLLIVPLVFIPVSIGSSLVEGLNCWAIGAAMAMLGASTGLLSSMTLRSKPLTTDSGINKEQAFIQLISTTGMLALVTSHTIRYFESPAISIIIVSVFAIIVPGDSIKKVINGHFNCSSRIASLYCYIITTPIGAIVALQCSGWWSDE